MAVYNCLMQVRFIYSRPNLFDVRLKGILYRPEKQPLIFKGWYYNRIDTIKHEGANSMFVKSSSPMSVSSQTAYFSNICL
jgi:hypothetical protein